MALLHGPGFAPPPIDQIDSQIGADSEMGTLPLEPRDGTWPT